MKPILAATIVASLLAAAPAWGHGDDKARHGGIVQMAGEIKMELVGKPDGAELHLEDHAVTVPTANLSGKLTVMSGAGKAEAKLEPAAGDKLVAKGVKLAKGDKVIAVVLMADKSSASARFVVR